MSSDPFSKALVDVKLQIKEIKDRCAETIQIIENSAQIEYLNYNGNNLNDKALGFVEGVRKSIEDTKTFVTNDEYLVTNQFLCELKNRSQQLDELGAYTRGVILDIDQEIARIRLDINTVQTAKTQPRKDVHTEVTIQHIMKAKERFQMLKKDLHVLITALFPESAEDMKMFLAEIMQARLEGESGGHGYIPVTADNFKLVELFCDMNIVSKNPYNVMEVKLAL